jgi:predicted dehydrogenase
MPDPIRLGIVGVGAVAQAVHLPLLERLPDHFRIAAVADVSATLVEIIGERHRVPSTRRFLALDDMLGAPDLDAVMILTSGSHGEAIVRTLSARLAVLTEKPMAWTLGEADAIANALAADGAPPLQVGYMKLYDPAVEQAVVEVGRETAGSIRSIDVRVLHPSSRRQLAHARLLPPSGDVPASTLAAFQADAARLYDAALGPAGPALGPLYADVVLGSIVHDLAVMRAIAGDPVSIDFVDVWPEASSPGSVSIDGRLRGDTRFAIRWHYLPDHPAYREEVRVVTDHASIELEFPSPYLLNAPTVLRVARLAGDDRADTFFRSVTEAFEQELLAFHALVVDGSPPRAGAAEGRADIVTSQRVAERLASQRGLAIRTELPAQT